MPLGRAFGRALRTAFVLRATLVLRAALVFRAGRAATLRLPRTFTADFARFDFLPDFADFRLVALAMAASPSVSRAKHSARVECFAPVHVTGAVRSRDAKRMPVI
jgi:hypothetical protein